jgi:isopentenyl diphosphate isomerase/L-lactate dehydrogenase-like FMN-dependent dehydrogenase
MIGKLLENGSLKFGEKGIGAKSCAGTGAALKLNRDYIDSLTIETRFVDSVEASTEFELFGETFSTPVMVAAMSGLGGIHPGGMVEIAKGAATAGAVMWLGIGDESELKEVIATGAKTIKIIKPYRDINLIYEKINQAEKNGAFAVGMDIDFFYGGEIGDSLLRPELMGPRTLDELKGFVKATKLPFIFKGVLSELDARKSLEAGAAAIVVSHHGGSVIDYAVPPLKILPRIAKVINQKIPIFIDTGIVRGTDVFKALALGADGVLVGKTVMLGLAAEGMNGVHKILSGTNEELRRVMSVTGSPDIQSIDPKVIWS